MMSFLPYTVIVLLLILIFNFFFFLVFDSTIIYALLKETLIKYISIQSQLLLPLLLQFVNELLLSLSLSLTLSLFLSVLAKLEKHKESVTTCLYVRSKRLWENDDDHDDDGAGECHSLLLSGGGGKDMPIHHCGRNRFFFSLFCLLPSFILAFPFTKSMVGARRSQRQMALLMPYGFYANAA
ncbi:unnamed protein product [Acanthosepion pharaonis]|uniref:Uncharacterized protein n=1 Tax=Acanthosepion pharaonis TaxID=158019 RepID=A0A812D9Y4_ACAPH|nr:unnamed protein product [Sepia pharaonis]